MTAPKRPTRPEREVTNALVCQALCHGPLETKVTAVSGAVAREGKAHVAIRYGRVLLYLEDRAALDALSGAVRHAEHLADGVFGPNPDSFEQRRQAALRRFERTGKPPLHPV